MEQKRMKAAEVLLSDEESFVLLWDKETGWDVIGDGCPSLKKESLIERGLSGMEEIVQPEDKALYQSFHHQLMLGMDGAEGFVPLDKNRLRVALHLQSRQGVFIYYEVECYFAKRCMGAIESFVMAVRELDAEDSYRIYLAQTITNDKNPAFFTQEAQELMTKYPTQTFAVIQFDVAKFKVINEEYGEAVGDELLRYFINKLKLLCRQDQLYVRLTADVFMILTPYGREEEILELIDLLDRELLGYKEIPYRLVYGVCYIRDTSLNLRKYGDGAAFARQSVKEDALNHIGFFQEDMKRDANSKKFVEDNMERALRERQFAMYLQPKYSISSNSMVGAEALVRWIHPDKGLIAPMNFVPLFEKNGFIIKLDEFIWEEACKAIRQWLDEGLEPLPVSVNVSRRHLRDVRFVEVLNGLTEKYQIPKKYLEIEITETAEEGRIANGIELLRDSGFTLLMDDFGSGYSSLNMLKDTQFDVIKIDREFLQDFISSRRGQSIVKHTIQMTKSIGLGMVAEGVETKEQAQFLLDCGCDTAQGFYYAKPMPLDEFNEKMKVST